MGSHAEMYRVGIILMAAGRSVRFGQNKLLKEFAGKLLVSYPMRILCGVGKTPHTSGNGVLTAAEPHVVTCYKEVEELAGKLRLPCTVYPGGEQSDTIRTALGVPESVSWDGCMFLTGDQPFLREESVSGLLCAFSGDPHCVYRLAWKERAGSPVIFPASCFEDLRNLRGDTGGSSLIRKKGLPAVLLQAGSEKELYDADTAEEFRQLSRMAGEGM